ncbi:MAG: NADAR family protein [Solirubrobacterales bacterium]|nr:NADAR family protein [Solirubrobacterales bacterium]
MKGPDDKQRHYPSVEHYFQASKTLDPELHEKVANSTSPREAKSAGGTVPLRADWEDLKLEIMRAALEAKFRQEPFRTRLIKTGERPIIEESRHDTEWGARQTGEGWAGENKLGHLLQEVRAELIALEKEDLGEQLKFEVP